jgi:hypothetical protein
VDSGGIEMFRAHDVIVDHFSTGWAFDDTIGGTDAYNITYQ